MCASGIAGNLCTNVLRGRLDCGKCVRHFTRSTHSTTIVHPNKWQADNINGEIGGIDIDTGDSRIVVARRGMDFAK